MKLTKDMTAVRAAARADLDAIFARRLAAIMQPMSAIHTLKALDAEQILASTATLRSSPLLAPEAKRRGITEAALARMVRAKAAEQSAKLGTLEAERQIVQATIDAATNPIAVEAILTPYR